MKKKTIMGSLLLTTLVILLIAGVGIATDQTGKKAADSSITKGKSGQSGEERAIHVYTSRHYAVDRQLFDEFTRQTGIKVKEVKGTAEELIERLKQEGSGSEADLLIAVDGGVMNVAKQNDVLQPIDSPVIASQVPVQWRDIDNHWVGISTRARVIVYAKDRVKPDELSTYEDLASDRWKGRVLVRSSSNLYNQSLLASFIELNGEEAAEQWARGVADNLARAPQGGDRDQAYAIVDRIGDVALMNTYYLGQMLASNDPEEVRAAQSLGIIFPNNNTTGVHLNISGVGLTKHAKNKDNAIKLIEFMTSQTGQTKLTQGSYEFPVNESATLPPLIRSWGTFHSQQIDYAKLGLHNKAAVELFKRAGWN